MIELNMLEVRPYVVADYDQLAALYKQGDTFGGRYDPDRDSPERLRKRIGADPDAILVAETDGHIVGTVSLIADERAAWLFRFAIEPRPNEDEIAQRLCESALMVLRNRGHHQVIVYTPTGNGHLDKRYEKLGFTRGNDYTCYWKEM